MSTLHNPFVLFGYDSPEYFCDRENESRELISTLRNGRNVTLRSPRRIGKTGLIHHVFHLIEQTYPNEKCFYVDLFPTHNLDDMVKELAKAIIGQLDTPLQKVEGYVAQFFKSCRIYFSSDPLTGSPQLGVDFINNNPIATLEEIFAYIRQSERQCYIAIDEFQQIVEYPETNVEALLRTHVQQCPNVHFVFSGSKQHLMSDIFNSPKRPFFRSTDKMTLDVIPEQSYFAFASHWMQQAEINLSSDLFHMLYSMVNGYTWYVQYILNRIYELHPQGVTEGTILSCVDDIIRREQDDYRHLYNLLTSNQAQVLRAIAKEKIAGATASKEFLHKYNLPAASSVKRAIDYLKEKEYIYPTDDGYIVYDRFMAIWLQRL